MAKNFRFVNKAAKKAFLKLPKEVQLQFSTDLNAVCQGERPFSEFKDIADSVGPGAIELIENGSPAYRAVYCAKYMDTVFILHAFTKTANGVDRRNMKTASLRYTEMMIIVKEHNAAKKSDKKQPPKVK